VSKSGASLGQFHFQDKRVSYRRSYGRSYEWLMEGLMKEMPEPDVLCASIGILVNWVKYLSQTLSLWNSILHFTGWAMCLRLFGQCRCVPLNIVYILVTKSGMAIGHPHFVKFTQVFLLKTKQMQLGLYLLHPPSSSSLCLEIGWWMRFKVCEMSTMVFFITDLPYPSATCSQHEIHMPPLQNKVSLLLPVHPW
jgi:hypothetical protein